MNNCPLCGHSLKEFSFSKGVSRFVCSRCNFQITGSKPTSEERQYPTNITGVGETDQHNAAEANPIKTLVSLIFGFPTLVMVGAFLATTSVVLGVAFMLFLVFVGYFWAFR